MTRPIRQTRPARPPVPAPRTCPPTAPWSGLALLWALLLVGPGEAGAQPAAVPVAAAASAPAPVTLPAAAAAPAPAGAASAAATAPATEPAAVVPAPPPPPPRPSCAQATDGAMTADLKAATAQSQRADAGDLARLFDAAIGLWQQAVDVCEGRPKERAARNLADNRQVRATLEELLGAGAPCASGQKDAATLQDLAQRAVAERRWQDATVLFRKAENMWELASERCTGAQQQLANQRREQVAIDGFNAEFCAPRFDRANEFNQRLRNSVAAMNPTEKQTQQQIAETLWREAAAQCKGPPLERARSNAQLLARERGTAWVAMLPPDLPSLPLSRAPASAPPPAAAGSPAPVAPAAAAAQGVAGSRSAPAPAGTAAGVAAGAAATAAGGSGGAARTALVAGGAAAGAALTTATVSAVAAVEAPKAVDLLLAGGTRLSGLFAREPDGLSYTGQGKVQWPNGDLYDGAVRAGKRHGPGEFVWANGQRYKGDWVDDRPEGSGAMRFVNGNLYEGTLVDGQPHGKGKMIFASGDVYSGQLNQGVPHGVGTYLWLNGQRYEGPWVRGVAEGQARMQFANGNAYEGEVVKGQPQGTGKLVFASGDVYTGTLVNGLPDGQGTYQWKAGDRYTGQWRAGLKEGQGTMTWANGDRWEGVFAGDAQTAQGQLIRAKKP